VSDFRLMRCMVMMLTHWVQPYDVQEVQVRVLLGVHGPVVRTWLFMVLV
jgi:hypothetical protein